MSKLRVGIKPETRVIARESTKIFDEKDNEIGKVTSGTFGPSVNASIAMGYISNSHSKKDTKVYLEVRGKKVPANVCDLPFYKKLCERRSQCLIQNFPKNTNGLH